MSTPSRGELPIIQATMDLIQWFVPLLNHLPIPPLVRQVPRRQIAVAVPRSPEVDISPVDLRLSCTGGVEGGAGVVVQEHVGVGSFRRAADRQLGAELLGGEPGVGGGHGSGGCRGGGSGGSGGGYPGGWGYSAKGMWGARSRNNAGKEA